MIQTNGIEMHFTEAGKGPLVILLHGFPELGHSWRHQTGPLAEAGYHVVVPDQRGYGKTDCPEEISAYDMLQLTGDIVGLVEALEEKSAIVVGHDFGAAVAQYCALLRPDIFRAVVLLSIPYTPRRWGGISPTRLMKKMAGDDIYYINYFQKPGKIEKELEENIRETMLKMLYSGSGDAGPEDAMPLIFDKSSRFLDSGVLPEQMPEWLTREDLEEYTRMFTRTGFSGPVNWYRNLDRNWELTPFLTGAPILQPALFIEGEKDPVRPIYRTARKYLNVSMPNLKEIVTIPGVGHWIQQEDPGRVNTAIINFLKTL